MQMGMIGLGRMGMNMSLRLLRHDHDVVGTSRSADEIKRLEDSGGTGARDVRTLVEALDAPRVVWMMVPALRVSRPSLHTTSRSPGRSCNPSSGQSTSAISSPVIALMSMFRDKPGSGSMSIP